MRGASRMSDARAWLDRGRLSRPLSCLNQCRKGWRAQDPGVHSSLLQWLQCHGRSTAPCDCSVSRHVESEASMPLVPTDKYQAGHMSAGASHQPRSVDLRQYRCRYRPSLTCKRTQLDRCSRVRRCGPISTAASGTIRCAEATTLTCRRRRYAPSSPILPHLVPLEPPQLCPYRPTRACYDLREIAAWCIGYEHCTNNI